jgi:hypothetical protein
MARAFRTSLLIAALVLPSCTKDGTGGVPPELVDDDKDMLPDQGEDRNMNGVVDPGETDPNAVDTDGDGIVDDAEVSTLACSQTNDRPFTTYDVPGADSIILMDAQASVQQTLRTPDNKAPGAIFFDPGLSVAGVLIGKRPANGVATASAQRDYEKQTSIASLGTLLNQQTRAFTTVQGYPGEQARFTIRANGATTAARTANVLASAFLNGATLTGTLPPDGPSGADLSVNLMTIYRGPTLVVLVASVVVGADPMFEQLVRAEEFTDGTNVARHGSFTRHVCDQFVAEEKAAADIIWVIDDSGSMEDDQMAVRAGANAMAEILEAANVDYRLGVARTFAPDFDDPRRGNLVGGDLTRDVDVFRNRVVVGAMGGWEPGLRVGIRAIDNLSPATAPGQEDPEKLRSDAALIVIQMSDERDQDVECAACGGNNCAGGDESPLEGSQEFCTDPGGQQVIDRFVADYTARNATVFALVGDLPNGCLQTATRDDFEPGQGHVEVANATGGSFGSLCGDMRMNMENIAFAATGIASSYQLSQTPASATIKVAIGPPGNGRVIPRSRENGYDYDPDTNRIVLFGEARPAKADEVVVGYRRWDWAGNPDRPNPPGSPADPCDNCSLGSFCDPNVDVPDCQAICGDSICTGVNVCVPDEALCEDPNNVPNSGVDSDGDGIPDSVDPDDDNDGILDPMDPDSNGDGVPDDVCGSCGSGTVCNPSTEQCQPPCEETGCGAGQVCSAVTHLCQQPDF